MRPVFKPAKIRGSLRTKWFPLGNRKVRTSPKAYSNICVYLEVPWKSKNRKFCVEKLPNSKETEVPAIQMQSSKLHASLPTVIQRGAQFCSALINEFTHHNIGKHSRRRHSNNDYKSITRGNVVFFLIHEQHSSQSSQEEGK